MKNLLLMAAFTLAPVNLALADSNPTTTGNADKNRIVSFADQAITAISDRFEKIISRLTGHSECGSTSGPEQNFDEAVSSDSRKFTSFIRSPGPLWLTTCDETDIYVPAQDGPLPVLVFHQGAKVDKSYYSSFARKMASAGILVAVPNHRSLLGKNFTEQRVLNSTWDYLVKENSNPDSILFGKVDTSSLFVMGHSFGGVSAYGEAQGTCQFPACFGNLQPPESLRGVLLWGAYSSDAQGDINNRVPILHIQGSLDNMEQALISYERIQNKPKMFVTIHGANHYGINDVNDPPGAEAEDVDPQLEQAVSVSTIGNIAAGFINTSHTYGNDRGIFMMSEMDFAEAEEVDITADY